MRKKGKRLLAAGVICVLTCALSACGGQKEEKKSEKEDGTKDKVVVATTTIPAKILEKAKAGFEEKGYTLEIKIFDDVFTQNVATEEGSVDANFYQYEPFMSQYNDEKGTHLVSTGRKYYDIPIGVYSDKYEDIKEIPDGAKVGIYSDASTKARCLQVLEDAELIKLEDVEEPTILDISSNPKNLEFVELDSDAKLTASFPDLDLAAVYKQGMVLAGLDAKKTLVPDMEDDTYAIILVVKEGNEDKQWVKDLDEALTTDEVRDYINEEFEGALRPLF